MDISALHSFPGTLDRSGSKLCKICSSIPVSFWSGKSRNIQLKLQSLKSMRFEAERGCQLCNILQLGPGRDANRQSGDLEILQMRRPRHYDPFGLMKPSSSLTMIGDTTHQWYMDDVDRYPLHFGFSLVPYPWSKLEPVKMGEHVESFPLIEVWLENCRDNHAQCSSNVRHFLPTRLLDLQAYSDSADVRLVNAGELDFDGPPPKYVTLSHCWGPPSKHSITTTKANLSERMTRIPFNELSQTFQDSIKISRSLRQRFLWIDSLCIIQDDEDDWAREAALMALVYSHGYFTLAALSAKDGTEGCQMVADIQSSYSNCFVDIDFYDYGLGQDKTRYHHQRVRIFETPVNINEHDESINGGPLNDRAWTLQEKELSRRVISFSKQGLLWECTELRATSQRPWIHTRPESSLYADAADTLFKSKVSWNRIVEDYSARSLTKQTDKLIALSGLARVAQEFHPGATYIAGMWSSSLPKALLWKIVPQLSEPEFPSQTTTESAYIAPTWSWASVRSPVSFGATSTPGFARHNLKVEEIVKVLKYEDPYGALEYGALVLSGALLVGVDVGNQIPRSYAFADERSLLRDGVAVGNVRLDAPSISYLEALTSRGSQCKLWFLLIEKYKDFLGIVLREGVNPDDGYTRVGAGSIDEQFEDIFSGCKPCTIRLI
ncbi:HET-domain-containing protein [Neurospora crassa]|nr:HET-domain-containing protein [Neurospora crassa]